jgi:uncharacterized membrane protein YgdD (TMEM256/DUF423 family)
MKAKNAIIWSGIFGAFAIAIGALGAHALKSILNPEALESLQTAVKYQLFHALALLVLGLSEKSRQFKWPIRLFILGTIFFSGSIYGLLSLRFYELPNSFLGPITPIGGLMLIAGWISIIYRATQIEKA